jgi:UDP-N-acetylmuramate dehydrogenase
MAEKIPTATQPPLATLLAAFGPNLEFAKEMAPLTTYRTGGRARYFLAARSADEIIRSMESAARLDIPYFILGGGSNLLLSDDGFDGLIIKVDVTGITTVGQSQIECGAGEDLIAFVRFAAEHSLAGSEFLAGIWGTVGGAIYGNAGAFGGEIGSLVAEVTIIGADNRVHVVDPQYCRFGYRDSHFKKSREIIVSARLNLAPGERAAIEEKINQTLQARQERHPADALSAGCFFKNIPDPKEKYGKLPAGRLLEEIGAKGMSVGGAKVFEKHANIIINTGNATSKDIRQLADTLKQRVCERFGIELEEEVQQLGNF